MQRFNGLMDETLKASVVLFLCTLVFIAVRSTGVPETSGKIPNAVQTVEVTR